MYRALIYRAASYWILGLPIHFLELLEKRRGFGSVSQLPCDYGKTINGSGITGIEFERGFKVLAGLIVPSHVTQQFAHLIICFGRIWIDSERLFEQRNARLGVSPHSLVNGEINQRPLVSLVVLPIECDGLLETLRRQFHIAGAFVR